MLQNDYGRRFGSIYSCDAPRHRHFCGKFRDPKECVLNQSLSCNECDTIFPFHPTRFNMVESEEVIRLVRGYVELMYSYTKYEIKAGLVHCSRVPM